MTYHNASELKHIINDLLSDDAKREVLGKRLREMVIQGHSFEDRAASILDVIEKIDSVKTFEGFESEHGILKHCCRKAVDNAGAQSG